jgi:dihydrofolate reductase
MQVSIIAAVAANRAIGKDNDLIWKLPDDLKFFRNTTMGHYVIMGRMNYESIPHKWRPLDGRSNVIITRQKDYAAEEVDVVNSLEEALEIARDNKEEEAFVIGGGQIYQLALELDLVDVMYLTHVHEEFEADVFFPEFDEAKWTKEIIAEHPIDERHKHAFTIFKYIRK